MRLEHKGEILEANLGDLSIHKFSFKTGPKLFEILSSSLYSDKIGSIVRELACNAWDSHVTAGKADVPFEIVLPSGKVDELNPTVTIRDFGTGISHKDIYKIYTCYGESSKTESDDVIGAFGLGSKTPFCYTSQFSVVSTYNGVRTQYIIFVDSEGYPSITNVGGYGTQECNGFEVIIPIKEGDKKLFEDAICKQLMHMHPRPKIINMSENFPGIPEVILSGKNWFFSDYVNSPNDNDKRAFYANVGNIQYTIDKSILPSELQQFVNLFKSLTLTFGIGNLDLSVSRETLQYTVKTKTTIIERLSTVIVKFFNKLVDMSINDAVGVLSRIKAHADLADFCSVINKIAATYNVKSIVSRWRGVELAEFEDVLKITLLHMPTNQAMFKKYIIHNTTRSFSNVSTNKIWHIKRYFGDIKGGYMYPVDVDSEITYSYSTAAINKETIANGLHAFFTTCQATKSDRSAYSLYLSPKKPLKTEEDKSRFDNAVNKLAGSFFSTNIHCLSDAVLEINTPTNKAKSVKHINICGAILETPYSEGRLAEEFKKQFTEHPVTIFQKQGSELTFVDPGPQYSFILYDASRKELKLDYSLQHIYKMPENSVNVIVMKLSDYDKLGIHRDTIRARWFKDKALKAIQGLPDKFFRIKAFRRMMSDSHSRRYNIGPYAITHENMKNILKHLGTAYKATTMYGSPNALLTMATECELYQRTYDSAPVVKYNTSEGIVFSLSSSTLNLVPEVDGPNQFENFFTDFAKELEKYPMLLAYADHYHINVLHEKLIRDYVSKISAECYNELHLTFQERK